MGCYHINTRKLVPGTLVAYMDNTHVRLGKVTRALPSKFHRKVESVQLDRVLQIAKNGDSSTTQNTHPGISW